MIETTFPGSTPNMVLSCTVKGTYAIDCTLPSAGEYSVIKRQTTLCQGTAGQSPNGLREH